MLSCEFCEIVKDSFFIEHLWVIAFVGVLAIFSKIDHNQWFERIEINYLLLLLTAYYYR